MAKIMKFKIYEDTRKNLMEYVTNVADKFPREIADEVAKTFAYRVKSRLQYNAKAIKESQPYLDKIANLVTYTKSTKSKPPSVTAYKRGSGLYEDLLFLEYGTGLKGLENPHPEASKIGWNYAINRHKYFKAYKRQGYGKKLGWSFKLENPSNQFVGKDDIYRPFTKKVIKNANGVTVKYYQQKRDWIAWVHTQGIKPVRAFYNTKREFQRFLGHYNEGNYQNLLRKLKKMRGETPE